MSSSLLLGSKKLQATFMFLHPTRYFSPKFFFKNYIYKTRQVGGPKMSPFVNVCTIENVNTRG